MKDKSNSIICPKCSTQLPIESKFCLKCGVTIDSTFLIDNNSLHEKHDKISKKVFSNKVFLAIMLMVSVAIAISGYKLAVLQYPKIENTKEIIRLNQELVDLVNENPILGSSTSYDEEIKEYRFKLLKQQIIFYGGYVATGVGSAVSIYLLYTLSVKLLKKKIININTLSTGVDDSITLAVDMKDQNSSDTNIINGSMWNKKNIVVFIIGFTIVLLVFLIAWQNSITLSAMRLYDAGKYSDAGDQMEKVIIKKGLGDYADKIDVMSYIGFLSDRAQEFKYSTFSDSLYRSTLLDLIARCIGYSDEAKEAGCIDEINKVRIKAAQALANEGVDVVKALQQLYENDKHEFFPLSILKPDEIADLIINVKNDIDQTEVQQVINEKNPLEITVTGTEQKGDYCYCYATLKNVSKSTHRYVEVRITYYDKDENVLTTDWTYAVGSEGIRTGESQQFDIMTRVRGEVVKYKIEIQDYD